MKIYYWLYTVLAVLAFILALPYMLIRMVFTGRYREAFSQMLGFWPQEAKDKIGNQGCIWIHAVSVGEAVAASAIIKELKRLHPQEKVLISSVTETGQRMAKQIIPQGDAFIYFPLDFPWLVRKALRIFQPKVFAMVETELWPNFLRESKKFGAVNVMINGRISETSLRRYRRLDRFFVGIFQDMLSKVALFSMQSDIDEQHILSLGAPRDKVLLTGNTKFDQSYGHLEEEAKVSLRRELGLGESSQIWVVGSTHKGEEEAVLVAFQALQEKHPDYRMILAPRHLDRVGEIEALAQKHGFKPVRRTTLPEKKEEVKEIILLDTIGELGKIYGLGQIVYVGGSLVPTGGHNLLEPAAQGKPVFFGPHMDNFKETTSLVLTHQAGIQIQDQQELTREILQLLADPPRLEKMGENASRMVEENKGASLRNAQIILSLVEKGTREGVQKSSLEEYLLDILAGRRKGWKENCILVILTFLSVLYKIALDLILWAYRLKLFKKAFLPCPVISIGNITVGGTGKTPTTQMLAQILQNSGLKVAILNRGYRSQQKGKMAVVSDGQQIYLSPQEAGDEAYMLAKSLPGIPVLIGKDRVATGLYAYEQLGVEVVILDDGYQYWHLERDLNIVLIDASNPFSNGHILPRGLLREPLKNLARANIFLLSKTNYATEQEKEEVRKVLTQVNSHAPILETVYSPSYLRNFLTNEVTKDFTMLQGKKVLAISGVSNPYFFERMVEYCGTAQLEKLRFPDHYNYSLADMEEIEGIFHSQKLDLVLTTEKDAVSIPSQWQAQFPFWVLGIEIKPESIKELELKKLILEKLAEVRRKEDATISSRNYSCSLSVHPPAR